MTTALVQIAQVLDGALWANKTSIKPGRELFHSGALRLVSDTVPVLANHSRDQELGRVRSLLEFDLTDGRWIFAKCELDVSPGWVRRGTPASFAGCHVLDPHPMPGGWTYSHSALVFEVSLLTAAEQPFEPRARVVRIEQSSPAARPSDRRQGEVILGGQHIVRRNIGRVLGVR